jgi:DNA-3-methyladenine glycosylase
MRMPEVAMPESPETPSDAVGVVIPVTFFARAAADVARDLVGMTIARAGYHGEVCHFLVDETEAYEGIDDLASHAHKGLTQRTRVLFGPAGRFYVYRIYGLHWMLNVVTGPENHGSSVLIRGIEGVSGPGRVTAALRVDSCLNGMTTRVSSGLWFEFGPPRRRPITRTARIGVDYAGPLWSRKKLRFALN